MQVLLHHGKRLLNLDLPRQIPTRQLAIPMPMGYVVPPVLTGALPQ